MPFSPLITLLTQHGGLPNIYADALSKIDAHKATIIKDEDQNFWLITKLFSSETGEQLPDVRTLIPTADIRSAITAGQHFLDVLNNAVI